MPDVHRPREQRQTGSFASQIAEYTAGILLQTQSVEYSTSVLIDIVKLSLVVLNKARESVM